MGWLRDLTVPLPDAADHRPVSDDRYIIKMGFKWGLLSRLWPVSGPLMSLSLLEMVTILSPKIGVPLSKGMSYLANRIYPITMHTHPE